MKGREVEGLGFFPEKMLISRLAKYNWVQKIEEIFLLYESRRKWHNKSGESVIGKGEKREIIGKGGRVKPFFVPKSGCGALWPCFRNNFQQKRGNPWKFSRTRWF